MRDGAQVNRGSRSCLLRELRPLIARVLPGILDDFYTHLARFPEIARMFSDPSRMRRAREMQIKHWDVIAQASFDETYVRSVTLIGQTHNRLGVPVSGHSNAVPVSLRNASTVFGASAGKSSMAMSPPFSSVITAVGALSCAATVNGAASTHASATAANR